MNWRSLTEAFSRQGSRNTRLAVSILFITLATVVIMAVFQVIKTIFDPDITVWESQVYTILFAGLLAPLTSLFVLLRFEGLYQKVSRENEERRRAEEALLDSKANLSKAESIANLGHWDWDLTTNQVKWSDGHFRIFGYPVEPGTETYEMFRSRVHPEDIESVEKALKETITTGKPYNIDYRLALPDGTLKYIHAEAYLPVRNSTDKPEKMFGIAQDITERKQAEEALRQSEERYKLVIAGAKGAIWDWDVPNKRIFLSKQWKEMRGLSDDEVGDREEELKSRIHPEDAPRVMAAIQAHFEGRTPAFAEVYRTLCKDGSWKWISDRGMAQRDARGRVVRMAGSENDITERKHAEEALRNSEARLNSIFRAAPAGIGVVVDRVITEANDKLCEMTGYTRDELLGKNARLLYPSDEDYEYVGREKYAQIKMRGTGTVETRWRRKDGRVIDIILSSTPMDPDNLRAGVTFTALDITERRRAEEAVRAADARFRSLILNSTDIIRILDRDGRIIYESPSSDKILGYPPGHTRGRSPLEFIHPDDRERVKHALDEVYGGKNPGTPTEFKIRKADGSYLDVESTGKNMIGVLGVDGIVITTRAITERKRAEEALKAAKMQADLYVDLMCHDISNMNQVGLGFLEMALDMLDLDETGREMLLKPRSAFENSSRLIDNVRKLQKARSGEYPDREMDVGAVLRKVQEDYFRRYGRDITINYVMNTGYVVKANELLYDLFSNLVGNAIKHAKTHPVIDISVEPASENGHNYYRVTIADQGPGIPDELKAVIFDRKLTGNIKSKGSGIGLLMSKVLTDSYKGRIWVEDRIHGDSAKGSRFVVMLPGG